MTTARDIANYLLVKANQAEGEAAEISNLKLQKLLYYVQGFHTVLFDRPAFDDRMEAWLHGPVLPSIYREFRQYGNGNIPAPPPEVVDQIDEDTAELVDEVFNVYAKHSAWHLRNLTHEEDPWLNNYDAETGSQEITTEDLAEFFPSLLE
ncbi:hypothetical protein BWR19_15855 [Halomonas sp. 1513]|nr:type II toxin-antitoxin system antitoxin SocA domain-containing protein [Halomonas sp. 1513]APX94289.1 hypothetical protein BWR19_15855 [Halomonas sp. 1513]